MRELIHVVVTRTFRYHHEPFTSHEVEALVAKVEAVKEVKNPRHYAATAAWHYLVERRRRHARALRRAVQVERRLAEAKQEEGLQRSYERARGELAELVDTLRAEGVTQAQECQLGLLLAVYIHGYSLAQAEEIYPKTSRDTRYQWKRRGLKLVAPHASEELRRFLQEGGMGNRIKPVV